MFDYFFLTLFIIHNLLSIVPILFNIRNGTTVYYVLWYKKWYKLYFAFFCFFDYASILLCGEYYELYVQLSKRNHLWTEKGNLS